MGEQTGLKQLVEHMYAKAATHTSALAGRGRVWGHHGLLRRAANYTALAAVATTTTLLSFFPNLQHNPVPAFGPAAANFLVNNSSVTRQAEKTAYHRRFDVDIQKPPSQAGLLPRISLPHIPDREDLVRGVNATTYFTSDRDSTSFSQNPYLEEGDDVQYNQTSPNYLYVPYQDLPRELIDALTSLEDRTFWQRNGPIDPIQGLQALVHNLTSEGLRGASTIPMQVARNFILDDRSRTFGRKYKEVATAMQMFRNGYEHEDFLELYFNTNGVAGGRVGLAAGLKYNFGLDIREAPMDEHLGEYLKVLSEFRQPSLADYFDYPDMDYEDNPAVKRYHHVLRALAADDVITEHQRDSLLSTQLPFRQTGQGKHNQFFVDAAAQELAQISKQEDLDPRNFFVQLTADTKARERLGPVLTAHRLDRQELLDRHNMHLVVGVISPTGEVLVQEGSNDYGESQYDRLRSHYSLGSVMKPFSAVYIADRLEESLDSLLVHDRPLDDSSIHEIRMQAHNIHNHDGEYKDTLSAQQVINESRNVGIVALMEEYMKRNSLESVDDFLAEELLPFYRQLGIGDKITTGEGFNDLRPMLLFGSQEYGENPLRTATALMALSNGGTVYQPRWTSRVVENGRGVVYETAQVVDTVGLTRSYHDVLNKSLHRSGMGPVMLRYIDEDIRESVARGGLKTGTSRNAANVVYISDPEDPLRTSDGREIGAVYVGFVGDNNATRFADEKGFDGRQNVISSSESVYILGDVINRLSATRDR